MLLLFGVCPEKEAHEIPAKVVVAPPQSRTEFIRCTVQIVVDTVYSGCYRIVGGEWSAL